MTFTPYIRFEGQAREALTAYAAIFGASDLQIMSFASAPEGQRPPGAETLVMHGQFSTGPGATFMACDIPPGWGQGGMGGASVYHAARDVDQARRVFAALAEGGTVSMPMEGTFWSPAFGMLTDRFGTRWTISVPQA